MNDGSGGDRQARARAQARARVRVRTERLPAPRTDPLAAYLALRERFGDREVYLLESLSGPPADTRHAFAGFRPLLTVTVTGEAVAVAGTPALARLVPAALGDLAEAEPGGGLRLPGEGRLWDVLRAINGMFAAGGSPGEFAFGFLAFFGYDTARHIEHLPYLIERTSPVPDVCLTLYQGCVRWDHATGTADLLVHQSDWWDDLPAGDVQAALLAAAEAGRDGGATRRWPGPEPEPPAARWADDTTEEEFSRNAERCLRHIALGDIYQVQIGHELTIRSGIRPLDVYRRLRRLNPSPYMYLAPLGDQTVVGASPELFTRIEGGAVTMRPIAGTLPRDGADGAAAKLRGDPKELAEHVMLVDLCRNDIGRICAPGTLDVPDMLTVEKYSHVLHLVSTVVGQVDAVSDSFEAIAALFPAGTMTGAPKIRAMEIIEGVESSRRGMYAGALGLIDVGGYVNLALCIRTLFHAGNTYRTRASAGIVADSVPEREWRETLAKMSAAHRAVTGRELLR
jgi:anthranilate/para-aminobenzoate synthase component I